MNEYITEHGEIIQDMRSSYQVACSQLAAFKFKTIETVAADPRLKEGACTEAIIVYLSFLTIDKETLKPKPVYASTIKLMARGKMKSKNTAKKARQLLAECGYLVPTGSSTRDGCIWYHVENPNVERVTMHINEAEMYYVEIDAERKREERRKRKAKEIVVSENAPPQTERGIKKCPPVVSNNALKYLEEDLRYSLCEGRDDLNRYSPDQIVDEATMPLPIPGSDDEAESMMDQICEGRSVHPALRNRLMSMLKTGVLSLRMASNILGPKQEAAA